MKVLFQVPFFAPGVARLPVVWDESIPTACTDGQRIRWNPKWFDKCQDQELVTVMCEEVGHCMLGHLWRAPGGAEWPIWNQACDQAVRNMMAEFAEQVKGRRLADPFPFPEPEKSAPNPSYRGMAEEQIYNILASKKPPGGGGNKQGNQPGGGVRGRGKGQPQPGNGQPQPGQGSGQPEPFAEFEQPKVAEPEAKKMKTDWDATLLQAIEASKGRGSVPAGLRRFVDEMLTPKVPWWELLRSFLREQCNDDWNWMKPNTYMDECPFILPSLDSEAMSAVVFGKDTSGSVDRKLLATFIGEEQNCLDDMKPSKLVDICCDSAIHKVAEYFPGDEISKDAPGGGGTSFVPIFEHVEKMEVPPKCVVILTDLDGQFPDEEPPYPVIWVVYGGRKSAPFGEVIQAE